MKYTTEISILAILFIICSCNSNPKSFSVKLDDHAFNKLPLPNETKINGKIVEKNFDLKMNETHSFKDFDMENIMRGIMDTTFQYYPITIKKGEIVVDKDTFQIGLIDENRNSIFNDINIDKLIFIPKKTDSIYYYPSIYAPVTILKDQTYIKLNEIQYLAKPSQDRVDLIQLEYSPDTIHCIFNSKIPDISIVNEQGKTLKLQELKKQNKNLIVELWFNGCKGCIKTIPELKKIDTLSNTIVSLSVVDELSTINNFKNKHKIDWKMIKGDKNDLMKIGNLGNYPSAVVYDQYGELIDLSKNY